MNDGYTDFKKKRIRKPRNQVKGFYNCERIKVKVKDKDEELVVTEHFKDKMTKESISIALKDGGIEKAILNSVVISERPRNAYILIKNNFRNALYLYNKQAGAVMVLEEDSVSNEYRILKTVYRTKNSGWIYDWINQTSFHKMVWFEDYFKDKSLSINDH